MKDSFGHATETGNQLWNVLSTAVDLSPVDARSFSVIEIPGHASHIVVTAREQDLIEYVHQVYLRRTCLLTKGRPSPNSDALSFRLIRETPTPKINKCRSSLQPALLLYDHQTKSPSPNGPRPLVALPMLYREGAEEAQVQKQQNASIFHTLPQSSGADKSRSCLTTETVQGTALALEGVDNVEGGDGLALGVLGVGDGVTNDTLKEGLQDRAGLLVDHYWIGQ